MKRYSQCPYWKSYRMANCTQLQRPRKRRRGKIPSPKRLCAKVITMSSEGQSLMMSVWQSASQQWSIVADRYLLTLKSQELSSCWDGRPWQSKVAENWGGLLCPFPWGELGPHLTQCGLGWETWHLDPSNLLATIHQRHRQTDRQTDRQDRQPTVW